MSRVLRLGLAATVVTGLVTVLGFMAASPAWAACHRFNVSARPSTVAEGATLTVTVTRDAGLNPSSIDLSSVDESAKAGSDYPGVHRTASFTTETAQSFDLTITDDTASEGAETFRLHLSNPKGCAVNPSYVVGSDARVTIEASDGGGTATTASTTTSSSTPGSSTTASTAKPTTSTSSTASSTSTTTRPTTTSSGPSSTTTEPGTATTEPDTSTTLEAVPAPVGGGGGNDAAVIGLVVLGILLTATGSTYYVYRRRAAEAA